MDTVLQIGDWVFSIDLDATMEYSAAEAAEHCTCGYCRNFYRAVDGVYPDLRRFLAQFGVDIEAPDEFMPFGPTSSFGAYSVKGEILRRGGQHIAVDGLSVRPEAGEPDHGIWPRYIRLSVARLELPWVLDEPMDEVVSPANTPEFRKRMLDKLLGSEPDNMVFS